MELMLSNEKLIALQETVKICSVSVYYKELI